MLVPLNLKSSDQTHKLMCWNDKRYNIVLLCQCSGPDICNRYVISRWKQTVTCHLYETLISW